MDFRKIAQKATTLAGIMEGRDKMDTEEVIRLHPDKVTITDFESFVLDGEEIYAYTIEEEPDKFLFAGFVLKKLFNEFVCAYDGDLDACRNDFEALEVKLERSVTKNKQTVTTVKVL